MTIEKISSGEKLTLNVSGRLDSLTAPELEKVVKEELGEVKELILDFENLEYMSSAGLRVILSAQKIMNKQGRMAVEHVNEIIMEVFEVTGFADLLVIR